MSKLRVFHIFNATQVHLVPNFIRIMDQISSDCNFSNAYILLNYDDSLASNYSKYFSSIGIDKFYLIGNSWLGLFFKMTAFVYKSNVRFIIHGQVDYKLKRLLPSIFSPFAKKFSLVCWGIRDSNSRNDVKRYAFGRLYNLFQSINCLMEQDRIILKDKFNIKRPITVIPYPVDYKFDQKIERHSNKDTLTVLVGHRANPYLEHLKVFEYLSRYKNNNISIVSFLNYGITDENYKNKVIETGFNLFGEKFYPITELLDRDQYEDIMATVDIFCVCANHQVALGAIYRTILKGGTIFVNESGVNYKWLKSLDLKIGSIEEMQLMSFDMFKSFLSFEDKRNNIENLKQLLGKERLNNKWRDFLSR